MDLSNDGLDQMRSKIQQLIKDFDSSNSVGDRDVNTALSEVDKLKDEFEFNPEDPIDPNTEIPMEYDIGIKDSDLEKLLPSESWFESLMPDFKEFFDFK